MIGAGLLLAVVGILAAAFFSGAETGLYRATRLRLIVDALGGNRIARGLLWLANHPALFVATTLVGTNLAHYAVSLALVLAAQSTIGASSSIVDFVGPLILAPVLFVLGELVPKNFFLDAPNRLLRRVGPLLLLFTLLLLPVSGLLWALSQLLERLLRQSPQQVQTVLARRQLRQIFEEGHEAGVLHPSQRALAHGVFAIARQPVGRFFIPLARLPRARSTMTRSEVLSLAQRYRIAVVAVEDTTAPSSRLIGYVRVVDLAFRQGDVLAPMYPLRKIPARTPQLAALVSLQSAQEDLAAVVDDQQTILGVITAEQLREAMFHAE
jgi:CBS domain containing-hemolysin-like protein